jgi:hypothetical protein
VPETSRQILLLPIIGGFVLIVFALNVGVDGRQMGGALGMETLRTESW